MKKRYEEREGMKKYKWCPTICKCGNKMPPSRTLANTPEPLASIYSCSRCEYFEKIEAEQLAWDKTDRLILEMAKRGELLDAHGQRIPALVVIQKGNGEYEYIYE